MSDIATRLEALRSLLKKASWTEGHGRGPGMAWNEWQDYDTSHAGSLPSLPRGKWGVWVANFQEFADDPVMAIEKLETAVREAVRSDIVARVETARRRLAEAEECGRAVENSGEPWGRR